MSKQLVSGKHRLRNAYWSLVGAVSAMILSVRPVMAETIWDRFSTIMRDIYGQLVGISTIVAVTVAARTLLKSGVRVSSSRGTSTSLPRQRLT